MKKSLLGMLLVAGCGGVAEAGGATDEAAFTDASWQKILTCDGAVVDVDQNERRDLQLVIRDATALRFLFERGVIQIPFGATEYVLGGSTRYHVDFGVGTGPKLRIGDGTGVFQSPDFDFFVQNRTGLLNQTLVGRVSTVFRRGSDVTLQFADLSPHGCAGTIVTSTNCGGEGGGTCPHSFCDGDDYTSFDVVQEYVFHGCE